jgi:hypothetical protein
LAQPSELDRLAEHRSLLVAQSGQLRRQMVEDFAAVRSAAAWVDSGYAIMRSGRALWPVFAGLAGLLVARRSRGWLKKTGKLLSWWRIGKTIHALWNSTRSLSKTS